MLVQKSSLQLAIKDTTNKGGSKPEATAFTSSSSASSFLLLCASFAGARERFPLHAYSLAIQPWPLATWKLAHSNVGANFLYDARAAVAAAAAAIIMVIVFLQFCQSTPR